MKRVLFSTYEPWRHPVTRATEGMFDVTFAAFGDPDLILDTFDCVIPMALRDYAPLRAQHAHCRNFLIPHERTVALAHDKRKWNAHLAGSRFAEFAPAVYADAPHYPFIYKKARDRNGENSQVIHSPRECAAFERERASEIGQYLKQEYLPGTTEYALHFLSVNGQTKFTAARRYDFDAPHYVRGKYAQPSKSQFIEPEFADVFAAIVADLRYTGTGCFNYKVVDARPKIFELNPRPGTSLNHVILPYLNAYLAALAERAALPAVIGANLGAFPALACAWQDALLGTFF